MAQLDSCPTAGHSADYPRPQLVRDRWHTLDGWWDFAYDHEIVQPGHSSPLSRRILVPFPPESPASRVGETGFHPVVWYRRTVTAADIAQAGYTGDTDRLVLHFGAVDYRAEVWVGQNFIGRHQGGHTPFSFDITEHITIGDEWTITVRAEDDPHDVAQPRGKQDWALEPHGIWYERTTGIWQTVWLEGVPALHISALAWSTDIPAGTVRAEIELNQRPSVGALLSVELRYDGEVVGSGTWKTIAPRSTATITLARQANGQAYESLLWSPEQPRLIEARVTLNSRGDTTEAIGSYFGVRSVGTSDGHFLLNDRPYFLRSILSQGYWPESHLAAPDPGALRREVELIKDLGFNAVRVHQKIEDPKFLMWADRLGLLVWEEAPSHFEFSTTAVQRLTTEWTEVILRDRSHPSIVTWVPLNESWGVQHISHDPAQLAYAQALYHLTKALDPSRPVISNDGWEHADSDIITIHDYAVTGAELAASYSDAHTLATVLDGIGPLGRRMRILQTARRDQPVMVSEFGGISFAPQRESDFEEWGYATTSSPDLYEVSLRELFDALRSSPVLAGFCYTQLTDTRQEANGLANAHRVSKLDPTIVRPIVLGVGVDTSAHRRPRTPVELPHA